MYICKIIKTKPSLALFSTVSTLMLKKDNFYIFRRLPLIETLTIVGLFKSYRFCKLKDVRVIVLVKCDIDKVTVLNAKKKKKKKRMPLELKRNPVFK